MLTNELNDWTHTRATAPSATRTAVLITACLLLASVGFGVAMARWPELAIIGMAAVGALIFCALAPKVATLVAVLWMLFQYMPTDIFPILPRSAVWIDDGLLVALTAIWVARRLANGEGFRPSWFDYTLVAFVVTGLISTFANNAPPAIALQGIRGLIQPILMYYLVLNMGFSRAFLRFLVLVVIAVAAVQCAFVIFFGLTEGNWWGDIVSGIFGTLQGTGLGHWQSIALLVVCGLFLYDRPRRVLWGIVAAIITIPLVLASSRISYFIIPVALIWPQRHTLVKNVRMSLLVVVIVALVILGVYLSYNLAEGRTDFRDNMSLARILETQMLSQSSGRFLWYQIYWDMASRSLSSILMGYGPGMFASFTAERNLTPMFQIIESTRNQQRFALLPASEFIAVPSEFGFIGLMFYLLLLIMSYRRMAQALSDIERPFWKGVALGAASGVIYLLFAGLTGLTWETAYVAGTLWLLVGIVTAISRQTNSSTQTAGAELWMPV